QQPDSTYAIVGVVADARNNGLKEKAPWMAYHSIVQEPDYPQSVDLRVTGRPEPVIASLRAAIASVDKALPVREVVTVGDFIERGLSRERLVARLAGSFGILALV